MKDDLKNIIVSYQKEKKSLNDDFKSIKRIKKNKLDDVFHSAHDKVFQKIDCLDCANCCKTTSPIFRKADIGRLAKYLRMKDGKFIDIYLKTDTDGDYVLRSSPCPFLWEDNKCSVYDSRPLACKGYPHTDRKNMYQLIDLTKKNTEICPAVCEIVKEISRD